MQTDRLVLTRRSQCGQRSATFSEKILGMHLDEVKVGKRLKQVPVVRVTPANTYGGC